MKIEIGNIYKIKDKNTAVLLINIEKDICLYLCMGISMLEHNDGRKKISS